MLYKLLRDNVETGPYTKSELMGMNLHSSDFIRPDVEGSNWILANKFAELKDKIVENAPKPKYKITADGKLVEISNTTNPHNAATSENTGEPATDNAPFKRTPSPLPKKKTEAEENKDKAFDYQAKETTGNHAKTSNTAFFGSKTETIKPKQKKEKAAKRSGSVLKEFIIPLAILGGLFAGWSYYNSRTGNGTKETRETINDMVSDFKQDSIKSVNPNDLATATTPVTEVAVPNFDSVKVAVAPPKKNTDSIALAKKLAAARDSAMAARKAAEAKQPKPEEKIAATETKPKEDTKPAPAPKTVTKEDTPKTSTPAKETPKATETAKKGGSVRDYVRLDLNKPSTEGFVNAKIRVNNISKINLNVAVVRVRYLDEKSNVIKNETLQVENIPAGRSVIVGIPDSKSAAKISYGVTMLSGDDVYIMRK